VSAVSLYFHKNIETCKDRFFVQTAMGGEVCVWGGGGKGKYEKKKEKKKKNKIKNTSKKGRKKYINKIYIYIYIYILPPAVFFAK
jgi:hypothetical protein